MAHRRRVFFFQIFSSCLLDTKIHVLFSFVFLFSNLGSGLSYLSLPALFPLTNFDSHLQLKLQRVTSGSDHFMGLSQRFLRRFPLKSVLDSEDVEGLHILLCPDSEVCPQMLPLEETDPNFTSEAYFLRCISFCISRRARNSPKSARMSHQPARPVSAPIFTLTPPPLFNQCDNTTRFLGFPLMGLTHCGPLSYSSWTRYLSGGPSTLHMWPKSVSTYFLIHSCDLMSRHDALTGRGLRSKLVKTWIQVLIDLYPSRSNQVQTPYLINLSHMMLSMARALTSGVFFDCTRSAFSTLLPETTRIMVQYLDLNGRGHRSWLVLILLRCFWNRIIRTLVHRIYFFILSKYSCLRRVPFSSRWERTVSPSAAKDRILTPLNLLIPLMLLSSVSLCYVSSLPKERTLVLVSFLNRDVSLLIDKSMKVFPLLTALLSSVMVHTGPVEATMITPVRIEVSEVSKSHVKLTTLQSVDELELKTLPLLSMTSFNTSPDNQSSFTKLVYLSLIYVCACFKFVPVMLNLRICPIMLLCHVNA